MKKTKEKELEWAYKHVIEPRGGDQGLAAKVIKSRLRPLMERDEGIEAAVRHQVGHKSGGQAAARVPIYLGEWKSRGGPSSVLYLLWRVSRSREHSSPSALPLPLSTKVVPSPHAAIPSTKDLSPVVVLAGSSGSGQAIQDLTDIVCGGDGGKLVYWDGDVLQLPGLSGTAVKTEALQLSQVGQLVRRTQTEASRLASSAEGGAVARAFGQGVLEELSLYRLHVGPLGESLAATPAIRMEEALASLWAEVEPQRARLVWVAGLTSQAASRRGGGLLGWLVSSQGHGDEAVRASVHRLIVRARAPFLRMLEEWVLRGRLMDERHEFFVSWTNDAAHWADRARLVSENVPPFLGPVRAAEILRIGRSVRFLRETGVDSAESTARRSHTWIGAAEWPSDPERLAAALTRSLRPIQSAVDQRVLETSLRQLRLLDHMDGMARFVLLGQGEFAQRLLDALVPEFQSNGSNGSTAPVHVHALVAALERAFAALAPPTSETERAVRSSVDVQLRGEPSHPTSFTNVNSSALATNPSHSFVSSTGGSMGAAPWEMIRLVYSVDGPLKLLVPESLRNELSRCFGVLWQIRWAGHALASSWRMTRGPARTNWAHRVHLVRHRMGCRLFALEEYAFLHVVGRQRDLLKRRVAAASHLDEILLAHRTFAANVASGLWLSKEAADSRAALSSLLRAVLSFASAQDKDSASRAESMFEDWIESLRSLSASSSSSSEPSYWAPFFLSSTMSS